MGVNRIKKKSMKNKINTLARNLRKRSTDTERFLWKYLRTKQLEGFKFRRQQPIGSYIVDFVCFEKKIVIEADGGQHSESREREKDKKRDKWLRGQGFKVLRFWDNEILNNIEDVLSRIREELIHSPL